MPEHTHIPVSRRTPAPTGDAELAEEYKRSLDPLVALGGGGRGDRAHPARHGHRRSPRSTTRSALAKQIATLDRLSGGRFVVGIGYGWNHEEMENHGIDPKRRRARVRETMLAMQALWANEVASFAGEFVRFEPSWQWPKPVQQPRPPVLIGGAPGPTLFAHIAEYGDGWIPIGGAGISEALPELRRALEARGRDPETLHIVPMGVFPDDGEARLLPRASGVTEAVLRLPSAPRDQVLPVLDGYARHVERYL